MDHSSIDERYSCSDSVDHIAVTWLREATCRGRYGSCRQRTRGSNMRARGGRLHLPSVADRRRFYVRSTPIRHLWFV